MSVVAWLQCNTGSRKGSTPLIPKPAIGHIPQPVSFTFWPHNLR